MPALRLAATARLPLGSRRRLRELQFGGRWGRFLEWPATFECTPSEKYGCRRTGVARLDLAPDIGHNSIKHMNQASIHQKKKKKQMLERQLVTPVLHTYIQKYTHSMMIRQACQITENRKMQTLFRVSCDLELRERQGEGREAYLKVYKTDGTDAVVFIGAHISAERDRCRHLVHLRLPAVTIACSENPKEHQA